MYEVHSVTYADGLFDESRDMCSISHEESIHPTADNSTLRRPKRLRFCHGYSFHIILVACAFIISIAQVTAIDWNSSQNFALLTWEQWSELYNKSSTSSQPKQLSTIYRYGPHVRAKIYVAQQISMLELQDGEAIFRQQVSEIVQIEFQRVQLVYLQTNALSEDQKAIYTAALSISALPDPINQSTSVSYSLSEAIDAERERIIKSLRYGSIIRGQYVTISSLHLFGAPMQILDIVLDGELFYPIDFKPWVGVQFAIGIFMNGSEPYNVIDDAYQHLRLRFLLARYLRPLQVRTSEIIIRQKNAADIPFEVYCATATLLDIEIHVENLEYHLAVDDYLRNASFASDFHAMEPQWTLLALDVNLTKGRLFEPSLVGDTFTSSSLYEASASKRSIELIFNVYGIPFTQFVRRRWQVLEATRKLVVESNVDPELNYQVQFGNIDFTIPSVSLQNGEDDGTSGGFFINFVDDPIDSLSYTLSFRLSVEGYDLSLDSFMTTPFTSISAQYLGVQMGFIESDEVSGYNWKAVWLIGRQEWSIRESFLREPFISASLTFSVTNPDNSSITNTPNFFHQHYIRAVLLVLLQQLAVTSEQIRLQSINPTIGMDQRSIIVNFYIKIQDENQRKGIASIVSSDRLNRTIANYSEGELQLTVCHVNLHADGSPPAELSFPGSFFVLPPPDLSIIQPSEATNRHEIIYRFADPIPNNDTALLANVSQSCQEDIPFRLCLVLSINSEIPANTLFLRELSSFTRLSSPSLYLPSMQMSNTTVTTPHLSSIPAPWIKPNSNETGHNVQWVLQMNLSHTKPWLMSANALANTNFIRLSFEFYETQTASRQAFTIELTTDSFRRIAPIKLRRLDTIPLAALAPKNFSSACITSDVPSTSGQNSMEITLNAHAKCLGGFFTSTASTGNCTTCMSRLIQCDNSLECRAISTCFSSVLNQNLFMLASILQQESLGSSYDLTWLLRECMDPSGNTEWSNTARATYLSGLECVSNHGCPVRSSAALNKQLVLKYTPNEQILVFPSTTFSSSLLFLIDVNGGDGIGGSTITKVFSPLLSDTASVDALAAMLNAVYSTISSGVNVTGSVKVDASTGNVSVIMRYFFLPKAVTIPYISITSGTSAVITNSVAADRLELQLVTSS